MCVKIRPDQDVIFTIVRYLTLFRRQSNQDVYFNLRTRLANLTRQRIFSLTKRQSKIINDDISPAAVMIDPG